MRRRLDIDVRERMTWGVCPVCKRPDGELCDADVVVLTEKLGVHQREPSAAHSARFYAAPRTVDVELADGEVVQPGSWPGPLVSS